MSTNSQISSVSDIPATNLAAQLRVAVGSALLCAFAIAGFLAIYLEAAAFGSEAALFPHMAAALGMTSAAVGLAQALLKASRLRRYRDGSLIPPREEWKDILISFAGPPAYGVAIGVFGYWPASIVGLGALFFVLGERKPLVLVGLTALTLFVIYAVFELIFSIRMPGSLIFDALNRR